VLRGKDIAGVVGALKTIGNANVALKDYAQGRREQLSSELNANSEDYPFFGSEAKSS
jgi:hypothetical protein